MADTQENELFIRRQPTALIGREDAIASVTKKLSQNDVGLLTLTGVAGVGKTRLAIAVLNELRSAFAQIVFIDLSLINNPDQVLPSIARSCGVLGDAAGQLSERLAQAIGFRSLLLFLDNCEHVLDAMPELSGLLSLCPNLKILATSREVLRLQWEQVFLVPPLPVPEVEILPDLYTLAQNPSVALFLQRAQARDASFKLTAKNARLVAELCIRLDGIPLAIELVATRVSSTGCEELLESLNKKILFKVQGTSDGPAHHDTLRTAIERSYAQLDFKEKMLFRRLSVFSGGWTLQVAEEICAGEGLDPNEILSLTVHLVDCSLVLAREQEDGKMRYRFPQIICEYAREQLKISGRQEILQRRHRDRFLAWAEKNEPGSWGPEMPQWLKAAEIEFPNFWAALEWNLKTPGEYQAGLRLWASLSRFWDIRGHFIEGLAMAEDLLKVAPEHTIARATTLVQASILARSKGEGEKCYRLAEECLVLSRELNYVLAGVAALSVLGTLAQATGKVDRAETIFSEAVNLARTHGTLDSRPLYIALFWQGEFYCLLGDNNRAVAIFEEALLLSQRQGDVNFIALILTVMGRALLGRGDYDRALAVLFEGLRACQKLDYHELTTYCLDFLGQVAWAQKQRLRAVRLLGWAAALRTRVGIVTWMPDANRTRIVFDLGEEVLEAEKSAACDLSFEEAISRAMRPEELSLQPVSLETGASATIILLTPRELEVAGLITRGLSNHQIADKLYVSKRTIDAHVRHILDKLELTSRSQVSAWFTLHQSK